MIFFCHFAESLHERHFREPVMHGRVGGGGEGQGGRERELGKGGGLWEAGARGWGE